MALWLRWHSESSILASGLGPREMVLGTGLGASSSMSSCMVLLASSWVADIAATEEVETEDGGTIPDIM